MLAPPPDPAFFHKYSCRRSNLADRGLTVLFLGDSKNFFPLLGIIINKPRLDRVWNFDSKYDV